MIVFDLDGTLSNHSHRVHLIKGRPRWGSDEDEAAWRAYDDASREDAPIFGMIAILRSMHSTHNCEIWTGRSDRVFARTSIWLRDNVFLGSMEWANPLGNQFVKLKMRPDGDRRRNVILKESWLLEARRQGRDIDLAFEDRPDVARMFIKHNVTVAYLGVEAL